MLFRLDLSFGFDLNPDLLAMSERSDKTEPISSEYQPSQIISTDLTVSFQRQVSSLHPGLQPEDEYSEEEEVKGWMNDEDCEGWLPDEKEEEEEEEEESRRRNYRRNFNYDVIVDFVNQGITFKLFASSHSFPCSLI